jgi:hypothetical protein
MSVMVMVMVIRSSDQKSVRLSPFYLFFFFPTQSYTVGNTKGTKEAQQQPTIYRRARQRRDEQGKWAKRYCNEVLLPAPEGRLTGYW